MYKYITFYFWYIHFYMTEQKKKINCSILLLEVLDRMTPYWFSCCCSAEGTIERHASTLHFSKVSKHLDTETQNKALEVK